MTLAASLFSSTAAWGGTALPCRMVQRLISRGREHGPSSSAHMACMQPWSACHAWGSWWVSPLASQLTLERHLCDHALDTARLLVFTVGMQGQCHKCVTRCNDQPGASGRQRWMHARLALTPKRRCPSLLHAWAQGSPAAQTRPRPTWRPWRACACAGPGTAAARC